MLPLSITAIRVGRFANRAALPAVLSSGSGTNATPSSADRTVSAPTGAADQSVVARAAVQHIVARTTVQGVVAGTTDQPVVAATAVERVVAAVADEQVGVRRAIEGVVACATSDE